MKKTSFPLKSLFLLGFFALFVVSAWYFQQHMQSLIQAIQNMGFWAPLIFVVVYCLATILLLPTMVLTLASGAIFGPVHGIFYNLIGATSGAGIAFFISRYLAYNWFHQRRHQHFSRLMDTVEKHGWQSVALLRLVPIIPFNLVNYGMGITNLSFRVYLINTFIFLIPPEIIYTYFGHAGAHLLINPQAFFKNFSFVFLVLACAGLLVLRYFKKRKD